MYGWPLVGRSAQFERLTGLVRSHSCGAVIVGPAGAGKSRLCGALAEWCEDNTHEVLRIRATESSSDLPLACMAHLLPPHGGGDDQVQAAVRAILERTVGARRLIILLDDLQFADRATLSALQEVLVASNAFLISSERSYGPGALQNMWKDGLIERFELGPLDDAAMQELLGFALDGPIDIVATQRLLQLAAGSPLHLGEVVAGSLESGSLQRRHGVWRIEEALVPSSRLTELVNARVTALGDDARDALELIALAEPLALDVATKLTAVRVLEFLEQQGLILAETGEVMTISPAHPVYGEVIRSQIPAIRRRQLITTLDQTLSLSPEGTDPLRRALLHLEGSRARDVELLTAAALTARRRGDLAMASHFVDEMQVVGVPFAALVIGAESAVILGDQELGEARYEQARAAAADDNEVAEVALSRARIAYFGGSQEFAFEILAAARSTVNDSGARDSLDLAEAQFRGISGAWGTARDLAHLVSSRESSQSVEYSAIATLAFAGTFAGPLAVAEKAISRARELEMVIETPPQLSTWVDLAETYCVTFQGDVDGAVALCHDRRSEAVTGRRHPEYLGMWALAPGLIVSLAGQVTDDLRSDVGQSLDLLRTRNVDDMLSFSVSVSALLAAMADERAVASARLDEYDADFRASEMKTTIIADRAAAWMDMRYHRLDDAVARLVQSADQLTEHAPLFVAAPLHDVVRFGRPASVLERLHDVAKRVSSPLTSAMYADAVASERHDTEALLEVARDFEQLGARQLAAETLARVNSIEKDHHCDPRIAQLTVDSMVVAPLRDALHSGLHSLTPRQQEIVSLATAGLTAREIADRLYISERTVSNHLGNVYSMLGINSRSELIELFS